MPLIQSQSYNNTVKRLKFIEKAKEVHGNKYDYSKVEYVDSKTKVRIICPIHGEFEQIPNSHLKGMGCKACGHEKRCRDTAQKRQQQFSVQAKKVHGNKYDYSKVEYINSNTKVCIICPEHGEFWQKPCVHLQGIGCFECSHPNYIHNTAEFVIRLKDVFGNKLTFEKTKYIDTQHKVIVTCLQHGDFESTPGNLLRGVGCARCSRENYGITTKEFVAKAKTVHGNRYDYSKAEYVNSRTKVCIICPEHGEFWQVGALHLRGRGCSECNGVKKRTQEDFIAQARKIHGNKYDYSKTRYINNCKKVCIICPEHGEFYLRPTHHLNGQGCQQCSMPNRNLSTNTFITKANEVHKNKYDYSLVKYINIKTKVCIICPEHGEFYQTPDEHLRGKGCLNCSGFQKDYKLSLLNEEDILHMSQHQLIELIANKKLPQEFKSLAYSQPDSLSRRNVIQTLKELYGEDEENGEEKIDEMNRELEGDLENTDNNNFLDGVINTTPKRENEATEAVEEEPSLPVLIVQGVHVHDNIEKLKPTDDAAKFIVVEELNRLWNYILKANEKGQLEECLNALKNENGGDFWTHVKAVFLNEYEEVSSIVPDRDYSFPFPPSLMQKLMAYRLMKNKCYGNWCGTGAGKTNAFLFATRLTNSHVTVAVVPNDVIDTLKRSIREIYPNSKIVVPKPGTILPHYNESEFTYIIYNYDKFQGNNKAEETINGIFENNVVDFVCLDEVQYVKVRDTENASSRSQFINSLLTRGREKNPDMKTLAMSATPCINNLQEVKSIVETLTGEQYNEIGNRNSLANIHAAYKALLINGFRYVPEYDIEIVERTVDIDCTNDIDLYEKLTKGKPQINDIEKELALRKLDCLRNELRAGTIVYATWVDGMSKLLADAVKSYGYTVESYNGESGNCLGRKEVLDRFLSGKTDVLVCSKPISTGVDGLQKHCNKIIVISLPWTDADYTQLKGRIYRQGSKYDKIEIVIPQVFISSPDGIEWSWDRMRLNAIVMKKCLGAAITDGEIQKSYTVSKESLLKKALEIYNENGFTDVTSSRKPINVAIEYQSKERAQYAESLVNETHRRANTERSSTTHAYYQTHPEEHEKYLQTREVSKESWIEDPVDRVAEIIKGMSSRYTRIIDMGCGLGKLKRVVDETRTVQGIDHIKPSCDDSVIEADIADLHDIIMDNSMDVAVYCLSLWGTNYQDYFTEAYRILDTDGKMVIVEPSSKFGEHERYNTVDSFSDMVEGYGFERVGKVEMRNNFVYFKFMKK